MNEITRDWLETFKTAKAENDLGSIFFRLALHTLPEGVDPDHPEVVAAIDEIRLVSQSEG